MIIDMKRTVKEFNWADIDETYDLSIEEMLELYRIPDKMESIIEATKYGFLYGMRYMESRCTGCEY